MQSHSIPLADWLLVAPVILGLLGGAMLLVLRRFLALQPYVASALFVAMLFCDAVLLNRVMATGPVSMTMGNWLPPFGISFTADAMGAGLAVAAAFVALMVALHLLNDAPEPAVRDGLWPLILLLMAGVNGGFLTGDLFNLYVWFEVTLIAAFGLIVIAGNPLQLDAAVKYGVINFIGTTLFLAALGLLYGTVGTLNMADIIGAARRADSLTITAIAALFAVALGIKSAAFPVNAWLPASYHAPPAAISALLGGILTKLGVYAFLRIFIMLLPEANDALGSTVTTVAILSMLLGPLAAIAETRLRRAIGFLLIGGVGITLISLPEGHRFAISGGILYVATSIPILAALYLMAGFLERLTGHDDSRDMAGLYETNPLIALLFLGLLLAVAGVPPFLGFWPKLLLLQGLEAEAQWPQVFAILLSSLFTLIAGLRLWTRIFWRSGAQQKTEQPQRLAMLVLVLVVLVLPAGAGWYLNIAQTAGTDLLNPARYINTVGLSP